MGRYGWTSTLAAHLHGGHCDSCPAGRYQDSKGQIDCIDCPIDTFNEISETTTLGGCRKCVEFHAQSTTTSNITGVDNATSGCVCSGARPEFPDASDKVGYYTTLPENASYELAKEDVGDRNLCLQCPNGAECIHDGMALLDISAQQGYWRPHPSSTTMSACSEGYSAIVGDSLARQRCCAMNATTNVSTCRGERFNHTDEQCSEGYSSALCLACADNFVMVAGSCVPCEGGASLEAAFIVAGVSCAPVMLIVLTLLLLKSAEKNVEVANGIVGQLKIMLSFMQILSALPMVLDGVPWPLDFVRMAVPLGLVNLEMFSIIESDERCRLIVPFLDQFVVHMAYPAMLLFTTISAYTMANVVARFSPCLDNTERAKQQRVAKTSKFVILGTLMVYPGLATRIFTVFRCKEISGVEGFVLEADVTQPCFEGVHAEFQIAALVFLGAYILGVPLLIFVVLWSKRRSLHDESHPKNQETQYELGGLYLQYEPKYWWFELVVIVHKMFVTGAMAIIGTGTPAQPLVGCLFQLIILLVTLKLAPYESSEDDWASFFTLLSIMITMIIGFALISDTNNQFPEELMTFLLIGVNMTCFVVNLIIMFWTLFGSRLLWLWKKCRRCRRVCWYAATCRCSKINGGKKERPKNPTRVTPTDTSLGQRRRNKPEVEVEGAVPFTKEEQSLWKFPSTYYCPITHDIMKDPVMDDNGHTYEREAISEWLSIRQTSPITRNLLATTNLVPNRVLKDTIELSIKAQEEETNSNRTKAAAAKARKAAAKAKQAQSVAAQIHQIKKAPAGEKKSYRGSPGLQDIQKAMMTTPPQWDLVEQLLAAYPAIAKEWVPIEQDEEQNDVSGGHLLLHLALERSATIKIIDLLLTLNPDAVFEPTKILASKSGCVFLQRSLETGNENPLDIALRCNASQDVVDKLKSYTPLVHVATKVHVVTKGMGRGIDVHLVRGIEDKMSHVKAHRTLKRRETAHKATGKNRRRIRFS